MPLPAQTFTTIQQLINYINQFIVPNASQAIIALEHNNVENALANFIVKYTLNSSLATIITSGGIVALPTPITVLSNPAPTAINWPDDVQNEYYIINATGSDIDLTAGFSYIDQFGIAKTSLPSHTVIHIAKATNGSWIQVSNLPGMLEEADPQTILGRYANTPGPLQEITIGTGLVLDATTGVLDTSAASQPFNPIEGTNITITGVYPNMTFSVTDNSMAFTTGTTGTDINWQSSPVNLGGTARLNIPNASGANRGLLTSGDFTTFSGKQNALTFSTGLTLTGVTVTADLSTGKAGGQSVIGGTAAGNNLTLSSTSNGTKGQLIFGTSVYDESLNRMGIGQASPAASLDVTNNNLGNTIPENVGILLANNTVTNSGATLQNSPELRFRANCWDASDLINRTIDWRFYVQTALGNTHQSSDFTLQLADSGGSYSTVMQWAFHDGTPFMTIFGNITTVSISVFDTVNYGSVRVTGSIGSKTLSLLDNNQFRIYNFFDDVNDEFATMGFVEVANVFTLSCGATGTGTIRNIQITRPLGINTLPVGTAWMTLGAGTTATVPLLFTSGVNNTTAQNGGMEFNGTNLFFTRAGNVREVVVTGNAGAGAPSLTATPVFTSYYGGNTNALGDPVSWLSFVDGGSTFKIPLYT